MLLPFRPITHGRQRRARRVWLLIVLVALALYGVTLLTYAFPGDSANWMAGVAGLDVRDVPSHPVLTMLGRGMSLCPIGPLTLRLNALAALAGALTVGWVYKLVWFLTFEVMREQSATMRASRTAHFGGCVAAATVAGSLPFWMAATRFRPEIFETAFLLGCAHLLVTYARSTNRGWLYLFGVLYGVGVAESPLFIMAAPVMALFAFYMEWKLSWCRITRLFTAAALSLLALGATHFASAWFFLSQHHHANPGMRQVAQTILDVLRRQFVALVGMLPEQMWLPVVGLGVGAATLTLFVAMQTLDNRRSWSQFVVNIFLTIGGGLLLFNAPLSPWRVMAPLDAMPAATYAFAGMGIGLLAASWRAWHVMDDPVDIDENTTHLIFNVTRASGRLLAPLLLAMVVVAGILNGYRQQTDDGAFADRAADILLDRLEGRFWVVSNGMIDANILIRAHERRIRAHLLSPYRSRERNYKAAILRVVQSDPHVSESAKLRAASLISYNFHLFIEDLFSNDADICGKAVTMGLPDIWYGSGRTPFPDQIAYRGLKDLSSVNPGDLLARHELFWSAWEPFLRESPDRLAHPTSYRHRMAMRQHLAFVANNLGVVLSDLNLPEDAFRAYQMSRSIDPSNVSALLNLFALVSRGHRPEMKISLERDLRRKVEDPTRRYALWALSRTYGYVRNYEMFMRMGWAWALSSNPGSILAGLRSEFAIDPSEARRANLTALMAVIHEMRGDREKSATIYRQTIRDDPRNTAAISGLVRLALQQGAVDEARDTLETGAGAGASKRMLRQDWAALHLVSGDLPRARVALQELADEPDATPMSLAMLAMVMIEQNDIATVEAVVLPRLIRVGGGRDSYFALIVQGHLWQSKGRPFFRHALVCFQRATLFRPDVQALQDVILMLVVAMGDRTASEARAFAVLRQRPQDPFANFVVGSIRLEQGIFGDAEMYLRRSVSGPAPTVAARNNFAQTLARMRKLEEAEQIARENTRNAPDRYEVWSTLALILASNNRPDDASEALTQARTLNKTDKRMFLVAGMIAVKRGDLPAAEQALSEIASDDLISVTDRRDFSLLKEEIARLRRGS